MGVNGIAARQSPRWSSDRGVALGHGSWAGAPQTKKEESPADSEDFSLHETEAILFSLAQALEQRDVRTAGHCERLAFTGVALGMAMRLERSSLLALYRGGYLHDVGKIGIPDSILFKPGPLNAEEWVVMRSHPVRGEEICRPLALLKNVLPIIRHHHERWDGSGYPDGLRAEQIPLEARLLQIADIYDALISPRPYKPAYSPSEALQIIRSEADKGWRDPEIVDLLFRLHDTVIARIGEYTRGADRNIEAMKASMESLQSFLNLSWLASMPELRSTPS